MKTMKLFFVPMLLFGIISNAQITKGNWMVGGSANFASSKSEYNSGNGVKSTNSGNGVQINPAIGYFLVDKLALGLTTSLSYSKPNSGDNLIGYGIGPFARYYLLKPDNRINILTQVGYTYYSGNSHSNTNRYVVKAGPVIYFNSSVGLEFTIDYSRNSSKYNDGSSLLDNTFNVGIGFQIHLEK